MISLHSLQFLYGKGKMMQKIGEAFFRHACLNQFTQITFNVSSMVEIAKYIPTLHDYPGNLPLHIGQGFRHVNAIHTQIIARPPREPVFVIISERDAHP